MNFIWANDFNQFIYANWFVLSRIAKQINSSALNALMWNSNGKFHKKLIVYYLLDSIACVHLFSCLHLFNKEKLWKISWKWDFCKKKWNENNSKFYLWNFSTILEFIYVQKNANQMFLFSRYIIEFQSFLLYSSVCFNCYEIERQLFFLLLCTSFFWF